MPHISPLSVEELPDELSGAADTYMKTMGHVPNSFLTMARKPAIAQAYGALQKAIGQSLTFSPELRAMMFLLQSQNNGCLFCQAHSVSGLVSRGAVPEEKLAALWEFETHDAFSEAERAALRLALAASSHPNAASAAEFDGLKAHYNEEQITEMVACLAVGAFLNTWNDTVATALDDNSIEKASGALGGRGWTAGKHSPST